MHTRVPRRISASKSSKPCTIDCSLSLVVGSLLKCAIVVYSHYSIKDHCLILPIEIVLLLTKSATCSRFGKKKGQSQLWVIQSWTAFVFCFGIAFESSSSVLFPRCALLVRREWNGLVLHSRHHATKPLHQSFNSKLTWWGWTHEVRKESQNFPPYPTQSMNTQLLL